MRHNVSVSRSGKSSRKPWNTSILAALGNDLNTSLAITALYDVLKYKTNDATKLFVLDDFDKVLSLDLCKKADEIRKRNRIRKSWL